MLSPARLLYQIQSMNSAVNSSGIPPSAISVSLPHHRLRPERRPESRSSLEALSPPPRALEGPARIKHSLSNNIFCPFFVGSGSSSRLFPDDIKKGRACTSRVNEGSRRSDVAVSRGTLTAARFSRPPLFPASPPLSLPRPLFSSSSSLPLVHAFGL